MLLWLYGVVTIPIVRGSLGHFVSACQVCGSLFFIFKSSAYSTSRGIKTFCFEGNLRAREECAAAVRGEHAGIVCRGPGTWLREKLNGADGRSRTGTAFATAPSRRRVYQFHHIGIWRARDCTTFARDGQPLNCAAARAHRQRRSAAPARRVRRHPRWARVRDPPARWLPVLAEHPAALRARSRVATP